MISDLSAQNQGGRPTIFSQDVAVAIAERIIDGGNLRRICKEPGFPSCSTVFGWLSQREDFRTLYALAVHAKIDFMADEVIEIADDASEDYTTTPTDDGNKVEINKEAIARSKIKIDTRFRIMAKLLPKKYGDLPEPPPVPAERDPKTIDADSIEDHPLYNSLRAWEEAIIKKPGP